MTDQQQRESDAPSVSPAKKSWFDKTAAFVTAASAVVTAGAALTALLTLSPILERRQLIEASEYLGANGEMARFQHNGQDHAPRMLQYDTPSGSQILLEFPFLNSGAFPYEIVRRHLALLVFSDKTYTGSAKELPLFQPIGPLRTGNYHVPPGKAVTSGYFLAPGQIPDDFTQTGRGAICLVYSFDALPVSVRKLTRKLLDDIDDADLALNFSGVQDVFLGDNFDQPEGSFSCDLETFGVLDGAAIAIGKIYGREAAIKFLMEQNQLSNRSYNVAELDRICSHIGSFNLVSRQEDQLKISAPVAWRGLPTGKTADTFGFSTEDVCPGLQG